MPSEICDTNVLMYLCAWYVTKPFQESGCRTMEVILEGRHESSKRLIFPVARSDPLQWWKPEVWKEKASRINAIRSAMRNPKNAGLTKEKMLKQSVILWKVGCVPNSLRKWQPCTSSEANQRGVNPEHHQGVNTFDFDALRSLQSIHYTLLDSRHDRTRL